MLYCAHRTELIIAREVVTKFQIHRHPLHFKLPKQYSFHYLQKFWGRVTWGCSYPPITIKDLALPPPLLFLFIRFSLLLALPVMLFAGDSW